MGNESNYSVTVYFSKEDYEWLKKVAAHYQMSMQDAIKIAVEKMDGIEKR